jgi:hypothetical protein
MIWPEMSLNGVGIGLAIIRQEFRLIPEVRLQAPFGSPAEVCGTPVSLTVVWPIVTGAVLLAAPTFLGFAQPEDFSLQYLAIKRNQLEESRSGVSPLGVQGRDDRRKPGGVAELWIGGV